MGNAPITGPCNEATYHVPYEKAGLIIGKGLYRIFVLFFCRF